MLMPYPLKQNMLTDVNNEIKKSLREIKNEVVHSKIRELVNKHSGEEIENTSGANAMIFKNQSSPHEKESHNSLVRFFNDALFGKTEERKNISWYTQYQLNHAIENGQSERVVMPGEAGRLTGYYHKGTPLDEDRNKINKVVLFLHGSGSPVEEQSIAVYRKYQEHGIDVLAVNMRGYGKSESYPSEKGFYQDARTMFHYLVNEKGITPDNIIIHGYSMGAAIAADLTRYAEQNSMVVSGLLLDRPMPSMSKTIIAHKVVNPAGLVGALSKSVNGLFSVEKNVKGLTNKVPIMLLTDSEGLGVEGEKLRSKLVASGYNVRGEATAFTHEQSDRLMEQYTGSIVSIFSG
ncbi:hypothetical protein VL10_12805 [Leclercia adecarboxylata]|nr:hypothetical protein VL10_12805 [Leclercia adecarboxylata]KMN61310.1 hypothetical protein VK95_23325 [Leclercia sp. LK8]